MKNDVSPLFSLADPFEYKPEKVNSFERLGFGPLGEYHVATFFRNVVASVLHIDYKNPIRTTNNCTIYNIVNAKNTVYGILFVLNEGKFEIRGPRMVVEGKKKPVGDFSLYPLSHDKFSLSTYRDSSGTLLINIGVVDSEFVVLDE